MKRLVGLPGEAIEIRGGDLYADGRRLRKPPGTLDELWLPVHDTAFVAREPAPAECPSWLPTGEPSCWTWQPEQGWQFQGRPEQRGELRFSQPVSDRFAYNWERRSAGGAAGGMGTPGEVLVPDLEIACDVAQVTGSGIWGFLWEYRADRLSASIAADGTAALVHSAREPGQDLADFQEQARVAGRLVAPPPGTTIRFAVRDGQAYLMQGWQLIAVLTLRDTPGEAASEGNERPNVGLFAEGGQLRLSRIRLRRDVYYLTPEQVEPYRPPAISHPIPLASDQYLVLGDNSRASRDSRFFGPIPTDSVKGVVRWTYWPLHRVRIFVPPADPADR